MPSQKLTGNRRRAPRLLAKILALYVIATVLSVIFTIYSPWFGVQFPGRITRLLLDIPLSLFGAQVMQPEDNPLEGLEVPQNPVVPIDPSPASGPSERSF